MNWFTKTLWIKLFGMLLFSQSVIATPSTIAPGCKNGGLITLADFTKGREHHKNSSIKEDPFRATSIYQLTHDLRKAYLEANLDKGYQHLAEFIELKPQIREEKPTELVVNAFLMADFLDDLNSLRVIQTYFRDDWEQISYARNKRLFSGTLFSGYIFEYYLAAKISLLENNPENYAQAYSKIIKHLLYTRQLLEKIPESIRREDLIAAEYIEEQAKVSMNEAFLLAYKIRFFKATDYSEKTYMHKFMTSKKPEDIEVRREDSYKHSILSSSEYASNILQKDCSENLKLVAEEMVSILRDENHTILPEKLPDQAPVVSEILRKFSKLINNTSG